jgi:CBS domain-containing membrane protein
MTKKVFTLCVEKKLVIAKEIMQWAHIRHIPVVDQQGHVIGIVSHRDLLHASISSMTCTTEIERNQYLWSVLIDKVMQRDIKTISPDMKVKEAAGLMREQKIGCLPVVNQGKLIGIITEFDLLKIIEQL